MSAPISDGQSETSSSKNLALSEDVFIFPASFSQQRLWLLDQIEGKSATYNVSMSLMLTGSLDIAVLERSLFELVARHEALRTNFQMEDDSLVQVIAESADFEMQVIETDVDGELPSIDAELEQQISEIVQNPFDLAKEALFRVTLLRLNETHHILLVTMHHIISDAWSLGVFIQELSTLYTAFKAGQPSPLEPLKIQYADFAAWQQDFLSGDRLYAHLDYWREKLSNIPPLLPLPTDRPRPALQTFKGRTARFKLSPALTKELKTLSQQSQSTVFMTLLAVFSVLLHRYTHYDDIVIGSPIANRQRRELEPLIGCFVNTLVLRMMLENDPTFTQLLDQVRQSALEAYEHQDVPFEKLVEELRPERSLSHSPLFQVMFILQNTPGAEKTLPGVEMTVLKQERTVSKFDLTLIMSEPAVEKEDVGFFGFFEYNSDLFEAATIDRMVGHFTQLLESVVINPNQPISALSMLSERERHQQLVDWNNTEDQTVTPLRIHELFEKQVDRVPDAIALIVEPEKSVEAADSKSQAQLTYRELNEQANQLARYISAQKLPPDSLIGVCLNRSAHIMVAFLGVLKAGFAYVPLDPSYPDKRLQFMVSDAKIPLLLTQQQLDQKQWITQSDSLFMKTVYLDKDWASIAEISDSISATELATPTACLGIDSRAYVIYTSGSTGTPKGVEVYHRSVSNFLQSMAKTPGLTAEDVLLSVTTLSFDIAVLELFLPLSVGASVVLVSSEVAADGTLLRPVLERYKPTVMQATPATWQMLIAAGWSGDSRMRLLCGGEALSAELAHQLLSRGRALWNMYGPTEATIWSTVEQVESAEAPISIGKPIANTQVHILDKFNNLVPVGVAGELHIGGAGLAKGYLNRPELTNQQFICNPIEGFDRKLKEKKEDSRLYKTGDLARYLPNGKIEHLGRIDTQVKLRGFRMELGEIESVLLHKESVQQAVVMIREDNPGNPQLVAYYVAKDAATATTTDTLRRSLQQHLPHYMVPSNLVCLDKLPKTPNEKIDRLALPVPDWTSHNNQTSNTPPTTPLEQKIADIWIELLHVPSVGVQDNFFAIGGHSLLAAQVLSRLRAAFGVEITLRHLFEAATIAQLSDVIEGLKIKKGVVSTPIPRSSRRR